DLTAERFRVDPFANDGSRMYRTGDIGSLQDGVLHFHGRADDQVKLRGFRIELGDIEAAAHEDPLVREAAAAVREFGSHDQRLVLYVTSRDRYGDLAGRLRERLRESLPPYMRPNHIVVLESMPTTPNGKTDRKALPMPPEQGAHADEAAAVPVDARERYLAALWCELIGIAEARADDNFFDLGGDSLLAVDMMARVERETGVRLNVLAIATGTLGSVAEMLPNERAKKQGGWIGRLRGLFGGRGG
ncbi:MAG TPA: phosphopantetheine-binding protein, partial [Dokdonella sp.]|nr:phosphopantetheine-binding protein [Dokdonella sp.]